MVERKYELPTTSNVIMGIGLGLGSDGGGNKAYGYNNRRDSSRERY